MNISATTCVCSAPNLASCPDESLPEFAFIGRSNVGKSSLLNTLAGRLGMARVSPTPGFTKLINIFTINKCWRLVDLPGYGFAHGARKHRARFNKAVAEYLAAQPKVKLVNYTGLKSHPQHELARRQMRGFGGMISIELGDVELARRVVERTRIFTLAESLGGVESLIGHPASMTHASVPPEARATLGIVDGLVRLSVGVEDVDDLIAALRASTATRPAR